MADRAALARALTDRSTKVDVASPTVLARMQLSPEEGFLLSRIEQPLKVSELLMVSGLPEDRTIHILLNALEKGAAVIVGAKASAAPTPTASVRPVPAPTPATGTVRKPTAPNPYGDFIFNLRELNEDIDLDTDTKKRILFLFGRLSKLSHYRILGVPASATTAEIRKAFLERSKEFHPDSYFRKRLGSFLERIEEIFRRVREANDVLTDDARRAKYDREAKHFDPEEVAIIAKRQIAELEEEQREKVRKERLMHARGFARLTRAREEMAAGDADLAKADLKSALQHYQLALELDPRLEEARSKMTEARRTAAVQRADAALEQATKAETEGNTSGAVTLLQAALDVDAANPRVHFALGQLKFRNGMDVKEARAHVRRAIDLGDRSGRARLLLGEILLALGEKKAAKVELKAALELGETRAKDLL